MLLQGPKLAVPSNEKPYDDDNGRYHDHTATLAKIFDELEFGCEITFYGA